MKRLLILLFALFPIGAFGQAIPSLPAATDAAAGDLLMIVDVSDTSTNAAGRTEKLSISVLQSQIFASPAFSGTITGTYTLGGTPTFPSSVTTLTGSQTLTNKTLTSPAIATPSITGAITFEDGTRQTFNPNGTTPGLNVGSHTADPSTPSNGDIWYQSTDNLLRARIGGSTVSLGAGGSLSANSVNGTHIALGSDAAGDIMYYNGTDWVRLAAGTAGQGLQMNSGATAPEWGEFANVTTPADLAFITVDETDAVGTVLASTIATTASVNGSQTGVHATPSTSNPLAPTWTGLMHVVWYGATGEIDLPAASGYNGRSILIYNTGAFTVTVDPNGSEVIVRDGTVQTGGVTMTLSSGAGNYVGFISDGARWITLGYKGTLAAGS